MIVLEEERQTVIDFIVESIKAFKARKGKFNSIGLYCCPSAGWISISFNIDKTLSETTLNCPDFEITEFNLLEFEHWEDEYESIEPSYSFKDNVTSHNWDLGDELINEVFFNFLSTIAFGLKNDIKEKILVQMLDSKFAQVF